MRLPRSWSIAIAGITTAILALWLINSLYALYVQVSWTTPWLATPLLIGILVLIGIAIAAIIYYAGIFQGWWGKSRAKPQQLPTVPVEKTAAATANLQAIRTCSSPPDPWHDPAIVAATIKATCHARPDQAHRRHLAALLGCPAWLRRAYVSLLACPGRPCADHPGLSAHGGQPAGSQGYRMWPHLVTAARPLTIARLGQVRKYAL